MAHRLSPSATARRVALERSWPDAFAREYVMERSYNHKSHVQAMNACMASVWISEVDKQKVREVEGRQVL